MATTTTSTTTSTTPTTVDNGVLYVPEGVTTLEIDGVRVAVEFLREIIGQEGYKRHWSWEDEDGKREGTQVREGNEVRFTMTKTVPKKEK